VLAQAADAPGVVTADLDLARQDEVRLQLGSLANRRPAAYVWPDRAEART
jgi:predicted amidohydrolase